MTEAASLAELLMSRSLSDPELQRATEAAEDHAIPARRQRAQDRRA
jgi:hypothetical protein